MNKRNTVIIVAILGVITILLTCGFVYHANASANEIDNNNKDAILCRQDGYDNILQWRQDIQDARDEAYPLEKKINDEVSSYLSQKNIDDLQLYTMLMKDGQTLKEIHQYKDMMLKIESDGNAEKTAQEQAAILAQQEAEEAAAEELAASQATYYSYDSATDTTTYYDSAGNGVLTKSGGVNYYNGYRETWYSQQVLAGGGLNIPGRTVRSDGVVVDGNGNVCVASSDLPKGSTVQTSLGQGVVYDSGCASGTVDIYTNW